MRFFPGFRLRQFSALRLSDLKWSYVLAHALVIAIANVTVRYPFPWAPEALTWAAFVAPQAFFVTDLCNRYHGVGMTRRVVVASFVIAVVISWFAADARIALASGSAFLCGQLLDAAIFNRLRGRVWWLAPTVSGVLASMLDGLLFFLLAFAGSGLPWVNWALADYGIKLAMIFMILPLYGVIIFGGNFKRNLRDSLGGTDAGSGATPAQTSAGHRSDPPSR